MIFLEISLRGPSWIFNLPYRCRPKIMETFWPPLEPHNNDFIRRPKIPVVQIFRHFNRATFFHYFCPKIRNCKILFFAFFSLLWGRRGGHFFFHYFWPTSVSRRAESINYYPKNGVSINSIPKLKQKKTTGFCLNIFRFWAVLFFFHNPTCRVQIFHLYFFQLPLA